jgi:peptide/nickel transport system permease protein
MNASAILSGPSVHHLLGTDELGRDVLSRLMYGGRRSLLSVVEGAATALIVGVPFGLAAGYLGGWTDRILLRIVDMMLAIPAIIMIMVVLAVLPHNENIAMVAFGILGAPGLMRVVRSVTLQVREELYIKAARVSGLSHLSIVARHVLPRIRGPVIVQGTLFGAYALLFETGIAYLGLTTNPTAPTWGGMVADASTVIQQSTWLIYPPGIVIALTILALSGLGNAIRDIAVLDETTGHKRRLRVARKPSSALRTADAASDDSALLSVTALEVKRLDSDVDTTIVDGVSFSIRAGETVGLVGESGCGKTITALAVLRLLPRGLAIAGGQIHLEGRDLMSTPGREFDRLRGASLGYVSQEPQASLDPTFTVGSQLREVIRHHKRCGRAEAKRRALELLRMVELPEAELVARRYPHELSGGMAQRVGIALALAGEPKLLIADEPTTALDVTVQAEILALLRRLQSETGMAILLITHNFGVVADLCDRTLVMYAGQLVEQSPVQPMFDQPLHPYTDGLLQSHPALGAVHGHLAAIAGSVPAPGSWPTGCRFAPRCPHATAACRAGEIPLIAARRDRSSRCVRIDELFTEEVNA